MAVTCIRLTLVAVLCFFYLICMNGAIPVTRSSNLVQKPQSNEVAKELVLLENPDRKVETTRRRMEIELDDYPGSGANNRHTPKPQLGRGCIDC